MNQPTIDERNEEKLAKWQLNLLPLMKGMVVGLTFFFFAASFAQLAYLHFKIEQSSPIVVDKYLLGPAAKESFSFQEKFLANQLNANIMLEASTIERRHHHARVVLMSGIWIRYLGFVTGMILAFVGSVFIIGKLEEKDSEIHSKLQVAEFRIKSASPGIILVVMGSMLMLVTIIMQQQFTVKDAPLYLPGEISAPNDKPSLDLDK